MIEFENVGDYGNFIYLDLIEVFDLDFIIVLFVEIGGFKVWIFFNLVVNQVQLFVCSFKVGVMAWSLIN